MADLKDICPSCGTDRLAATIRIRQAARPHTHRELLFGRRA